MRRNSYGIHVAAREFTNGVTKELTRAAEPKEQKDHCPLCRTEYPESDEEVIEQLRSWVEKGKAWAQCSLGDKYYNGVIGVDQSYITCTPTSESTNCPRVKGMQVHRIVWV